MLRGYRDPDRPIVSCVCINRIIELEKAAQGKPSAKYRPTRLVVDAASRPIGKTRHGEHKIANISVNCQRI